MIPWSNYVDCFWILGCCITRYQILWSITNHGNRLPGKRPHGNRIRAWGLSAARSAPILHHSFTRWCARHWRVQFLEQWATSQQNKPGKLYGCHFLMGCKKDRVEIWFVLRLLFVEDLGNIQPSCDGHNVCGAGCLCLWSMAYCNNSQSVLLSAVLLARGTNCGLFFDWKCGEQTRRHGSSEVRKHAKQLSLWSASTKPDLQRHSYEGP